MLGIASRKAGAEVQCPKCGVSQIVPNEEAAAAALAMDQFAKTQLVDENTANLVVYDDEPSAINIPRPRHTERSRTGDAEASIQQRDSRHPPSTQPATSGKTATSAKPATSAKTANRSTKQAARPEKTAASAAAPTSPPPTIGKPEPPAVGKPVPRGMILFPRRAYYVQGLLFLILAAASFGSGYFIGRGDATLEKQIALEQSSKQSVLLEGRLVYNPGTGQITGDHNAVILALPELPREELPAGKLPIDGIRPQDPPPPQTQRSVRMINELGGAYARANLEGNFFMQVPDQGKYYLLIISRNTERPQGTEIDELDLADMKKYFKLAEHLVGRYKYRWELREIDFGTDTIEENFGRDGQD